MVPANATNEAGATVADVAEYLKHDEWEVALYGRMLRQDRGERPVVRLGERRLKLHPRSRVELGPQPRHVDRTRHLHRTADSH